MKNQELLAKVAPCSLLCHTCSAYRHGAICGHAKSLLQYLEGIKGFYEKHIPDAAESYENFENVLGIYSTAACSGCRSGEHHGCSISGCFLLSCTKEHGVNFCGECGEFPCKKPEGLFEEEVYGQWLQGNLEIQKNGTEVFWESHSQIPHYRPYKKE